MTQKIPGVVPLDLAPDSWAPRKTGVIAARRAPGSGVREAILRCEGDVWCLSLMVAPDPSEQVSWTDLDAVCTDLLGEPPQGVIGVARLYLTHLAPRERTQAVVSKSLWLLVPADPAAPASWSERGVITYDGLTVWDASAGGDTVRERRLLITAQPEHDQKLSTWSWIGTGPDLPLPPLARYLLNAAKLRHQVGVWRTGREPLFELRRRADAAISSLLPSPARSPSADERRIMLETAAARVKAIDELQTCQLGLIDGLTRLQEMRRTVEIAASNMGHIRPTTRPEGPFADDLALAEWFAQQLADDALYVDSAVQRASQIGGLVDQILERALRRRQEGINLGLTGALGAILMALTAIQAFQYTVQIPQPAKPALIALLGSFALLSSMIVANIVASRRRWAIALAHAAAGSVGATSAWLLVAIATGRSESLAITVALAGVGLALAVITSLSVAAAGRRRGSSPR